MNALSCLRAVRRWLAPTRTELTAQARTAITEGARRRYEEDNGYGPDVFTDDQLLAAVKDAFTAEAEMLVRYDGDRPRCKQCVVGWDPAADRCGLIAPCPDYPACSQPQGRHRIAGVAPGEVLTLGEWKARTR